MRIWKIWRMKAIKARPLGVMDRWNYPSYYENKADKRWERESQRHVQRCSVQRTHCLGIDIANNGTKRKAKAETMIAKMKAHRKRI